MSGDNAGTLRLDAQSKREAARIIADTTGRSATQVAADIEATDPQLAALIRLEIPRASQRKAKATDLAHGNRRSTK
ncbi:MAG: hypothetical protein ABJB12_03865 [Pseudomonadota bacterium]